MIARLHGTIVEIGSERLVVDVGGVGYEVFVPERTAQAAALDASITLQIYTVVRADAIQLYGFATPAEKACFQQLITVNSVGVRIGLAALSTLPVDGLAKAINGNDLAALTRIPSVGKKIAERIVLELKGKIAYNAAAIPTSAPKPTADDPLPLALAQLGYKKSEIDVAVARLVERGMADAALDKRLAESLRIFASGARA